MWWLRSQADFQLVIAEQLTVLPALVASGLSGERSPIESELARDLRRAWDLAVLSNHHDFITGTSPDRIWQEEQRYSDQPGAGIDASSVEQVRALSFLFCRDSREMVVSCPPLIERE
jgi:hypothetical protein